MSILRPVVLLSAALAACGGKEAPAVPAAAPAPAAPAPAAPAPPQDVMIRGTIRMLPAAMFRSCDASALTALVDSTGDRIPGLYRATGSNDQDGMYVEGRAAAGAGTGKVVLKSVELATQAGDAWSCDRPAPAWRYRATGRNPAWSVTVSSTGITYEAPDSAVRISFPAAPPEDSSGFIRFAVNSTDGGGHSIHLLLEPRGCNIGSSGTWAAMQSRVVLDGKPFNGCASRGTER